MNYTYESFCSLSKSPVSDSKIYILTFELGELLTTSSKRKDNLYYLNMIWLHEEWVLSARIM